MFEFFRRLNHFFHRDRFDRELANDLAFHREMAERSHGVRLGNELRLREQSREVWGFTWLERLFQDLRFSFRMMRKTPGFTLAAILTLAVGAGVNIAAFGYFDFMALRPLSIHQPETLLRFHRRSPELYSFVLPYPEMAFIRDHTRTLSSVLAVNGTHLTLDGESKAIEAEFVTANWFSDLGAAAAAGRLFDPTADDLPGAAPVVVLGYAFWQRHFGGDPSVVGRVIRLNTQPVTVIGVTAPEFNGLTLDVPPLWIPISQQPYFAAGSKLFTDYSTENPGVMMWGRPRAGDTLAAIEQELASLVAQLRRESATTSRRSSPWSAYSRCSY